MSNAQMNWNDGLSRRRTGVAEKVGTLVFYPYQTEDRAARMYQRSVLEQRRSISVLPTLDYSWLSMQMGAVVPC